MKFRSPFSDFPGIMQADSTRITRVAIQVVTGGLPDKVRAMLFKGDTRIILTTVMV